MPGWSFLCRGSDFLKNWLNHFHKIVLDKNRSILRSGVTVRVGFAVDETYCSNFIQALNPFWGKIYFRPVTIDLEVLVFCHLSSTKTMTSSRGYFLSPQLRFNAVGIKFEHFSICSLSHMLKWPFAPCEQTTTTCALMQSMALWQTPKFPSCCKVQSEKLKTRDLYGDAVGDRE